MYFRGCVKCNAGEHINVHYVKFSYTHMKCEVKQNEDMDGRLWLEWVRHLWQSELLLSCDTLKSLNMLQYIYI